MSTKTVQTKWYRFRQNNSGGSFRKPAVTVYVEAMDAAQANARAEGLGIYFGGEGDCSCCGDRWHETSESDYDSSTEEPTEEVLEWAGWGTKKVPEAVKFSLGEKTATVLPVRKVERK
jgi:hypothetical protein